MLKLKLEQPSDKYKLYSKTDLKLEPGITILIGPNRFR